jgi:uncharacterized protein (TIGR03067 family)
MRTPARLLLAAALVLPTALRAADDPAPEGDLAKLQGKWKANVGPDKDIPIVVAIQGNSVTLTFTNRDGEKVEIKGEVKLDEKASPKACDWIHFKRPDGTDADPNLGIYKIEGDTFTVCNGGPNNPRPTEFKDGDNGPPNLLVLERVKDQADK